MGDEGPLAAPALDQPVVGQLLEGLATVIRLTENRSHSSASLGSGSPARPLDQGPEVLLDGPVAGLSGLVGVR